MGRKIIKIPYLSSLGNPFIVETKQKYITRFGDIYCILLNEQQYRIPISSKPGTKNNKKEC